MAKQPVPGVHENFATKAGAETGVPGPADRFQSALRKIATWQFNNMEEVAEFASAELAAVDASPAPESHVRVADFANRLFDLHGFMVLHSAGSDGKSTITISFPDLGEAHQFHNTLVELSQHRSTTEGSDNG